MRHARADEAEAVEALHWASLEAAYRGRIPGWPEQPRRVHERRERWSRWIGDPDIHTVVALASGGIVGFYTLRGATDTDLDPTDVCEMPTLYVAPERWRRGCGRALCQHAIGVGAGHRFRAMVLWVLDVNVRARAFYQALGFLADGRSGPVPESTYPLTVSRFRIDLG